MTEAGGNEKIAENIYLNLMNRCTLENIYLSDAIKKSISDALDTKDAAHAKELERVGRDLMEMIEHKNALEKRVKELEAEKSKWACGHTSYKVCGQCADTLEQENSELRMELRKHCNFFCT